MAGPWEQFQQQDGPWTQFAVPVYQRPDAAAIKTGDEARNAYIAAKRAGDTTGAQTFLDLASRLDREAYSPLRGMSEFEGQLASAGSTVDSTIRGLKQAGVGLGALVTGAIGADGVSDSLRRRYDQLKQDQTEANAINEPLNREYRTGQVLGYGAQALGPGLALRGLSKIPAIAEAFPALTAASNALLPTTVAGAAANGAVLGALQPIDSTQGEGSRVGNTVIGGAAGAAGQAAAPLVGSLIRGGNSLIQPFTQSGRERIVGGLLRRFATDPTKIAAPLADPVTGMAPTLAEATLDPGIAQLQRAAWSKSKDVADAITLSRQGANQQRMGLLQNFVGTPAQRDAALASVKSAEEAAYGAISQLDGVDVAPVAAQIDGILAGGAGKRDAVRAALGRARDALFKSDGTPETSVDALLGARQNIGDMLSGLGDNASAKLASKELIAVRDALDEQIRQVAGDGLDAALDARRIGMRPVNEMDTVRGLLANTTADIPDASGGLLRGFNASSFVKATDDFGFTSGVDRAARQATGWRGATGDKTLGPAASQAIDDVRVGLLRQLEADRLAKVPGSPTAQFLAGQNVMESIAGPLGLKEGGAIRNAVGPLVENITGRAYGAIGLEDRLQPILAEALTNPQRAAQLIQRLPPRDRALVEAAIAPYARAGLIGVASADQ